MASSRARTELISEPSFGREKLETVGRGTFCASATSSSPCERRRLRGDGIEPVHGNEANSGVRIQKIRTIILRYGYGMKESEDEADEVNEPK